MRLLNSLHVRMTLGEFQHSHNQTSICELTLAWLCRDDAQNKLVALKEKADKELAQYSMELKVGDWTRVVSNVLPLVHARCRS